MPVYVLGWKGWLKADSGGRESPDWRKQKSVGGEEGHLLLAKEHLKRSRGSSYCHSEPRTHSGPVTSSHAQSFHWCLVSWAIGMPVWCRGENPPRQAASHMESRRMNPPTYHGKSCGRFFWEPLEVRKRALAKPAQAQDRATGGTQRHGAGPLRFAKGHRS